MPFNGSDLINEPWTTIFSPYTNLLGMGAYLFMFVFIIAAVYLKTRNAISTFSVMILVGLLFTGTGIWTGFEEVSYIFIGLSAFAVIGLVMSIIYGMRR